MDINDELKKAQLDKDWTSIKRIFEKINSICLDEADMNILEFLKYRDNTSELCRYYSIHSKTKVGPYKNKPNWKPRIIKYKTNKGKYGEDASGLPTPNKKS